MAYMALLACTDNILPLTLVSRSQTFLLLRDITSQVDESGTPYVANYLRDLHVICLPLRVTLRVSVAAPKNAVRNNEDVTTDCHFIPFHFVLLHISILDC